MQGTCCMGLDAHQLMTCCSSMGTFDAIRQTCLMVLFHDQHMSAPRPTPSHTRISKPELHPGQSLTPLAPLPSRALLCLVVVWVPPPPPSPATAPTWRAAPHIHALACPVGLSGCHIVIVIHHIVCHVRQARLLVPQGTGLCLLLLSAAVGQALVNCTGKPGSSMHCRDALHSWQEGGREQCPSTFCHCWAGCHPLQAATEARSSTPCSSIHAATKTCWPWSIRHESPGSIGQALISCRHQKRL